MRKILKHIYIALRALLLRLVIFPSFTKDFAKENVKSILAVRIDRIGDLIVSLPAMKALKAIFPLSRLVILARGSHAPLLKSLPWIDEVIVYRSLWSAITTVRQRRFSLCVDFLMDYTLRTALIVSLGGARASVGFDIGERGRLFSIPVKPVTKKKQMTDHLFDLVRAIARAFGIEEATVETSDPALCVSPEACIEASKLLADRGIVDGDLLVSVHPGGYYPSQRWASGRFTDLCRKINGRYGARFLIIGSEEEKSLIMEIASQVGPAAFPLVGLPLDILAAIIATTDLFIGNNSGPLHIAASLGVPTVSTMGPTDRHLWYPRGPGNIVIRHDTACSPCDRGVCLDNRCMWKIHLDDMERAAEKQLENIEKAKGKNA